MPNIFIIKRLNSHTLLPCQISEEVSKCPQFQYFITQARANQRFPHIWAIPLFILAWLFPLYFIHPISPRVGACKCPLSPNLCP